MFVFTNSKEKQSPTIIGAGCHIHGEIKTDHIVQVHGTVSGNITGDKVVIGRGGNVIGKVSANEFFLHGAMNGPAVVETANVFSDAKMTGTLSYSKLNISENCGLECKLNKRKK
jgi:cytoskeletal protein CcmA (bactofilin family)